MLAWAEYVSQLLERESSCDGISLSFGDGRRPVGVPPLIKASVLMLDRMLECQGKFNILVFPERIQSIFIFTLVKLLHNIAEGRIDRTYDPSSFVPGEHLRLKKAIVEFIGVEEHDQKKCIRLRLSDLSGYIAPIEFLPLFQKTTATRLSKFKAFVEAKKEAEKELVYLTADERFLKLLMDYKTHMDSSIVNMTSVINTKDQINNCKLCGQSIKDMILVGQADFEGNVKNIGAGQLGGTPAIVLASDLYAISRMAQNGHPIQSIIIDGSNANTLLSQMDALDELMRLGVPITCVTDVVNSFDLQPFLDRQFNMWRWDENSITENLYDITTLNSDIKTKHCAQRSVDYLLADGNEISEAIRLLSLHKSESQMLSAQMLKVFDKLFSMAFETLWETVPHDESQRSRARAVLEECSVVLEYEKPFIAEETLRDYRTVVDGLKKVYTQGYVLPKYKALCERLKNETNSRVFLIVPERCDKFRVQSYWQNWCRRNMVRLTIDARYPSEYYLIQCSENATTIVVGWFKRAIMRKLLYSFNTKSYSVLLYDYEKRWKNYTTWRWSKALDSGKNRETIEKSFATDKVRISTSQFIPPEPPQPDHHQTDEYAEIEIILRDNKYRQYVASGGQSSENQTVEAIPVNFVGGCLAFYRLGHRLISATKIIMDDISTIETKLPEELKMGDFIVVREADHDLITEMADLILHRSGMSGMRELAGKWRIALKFETIFYTNEEIYQHLKDAGCTSGWPTVKRWLEDRDIIAPQSKLDLECIAKITGNEVLKELLDQVYDAAQYVRTAHTQAGRELSIKLRNRIVEALQEHEDIDPFNIWEPIEMQVEGVGPVRILKIIDIGSSVRVDISDTNHLINEE